jgi:peptidyl-Lys metalloendopeptidase
MFAAALLAIAASVVSVSAAPGLALKVSGPDNVRGVDSLRLVTELVNTGDETLKLLNDPRTILRKLPTNTFSIVHEDSHASPKFAGAKVKYTHESAAKYGQDDAFTVLAPGQSFKLTHDRTSRESSSNFSSMLTLVLSFRGLQLHRIWRRSLLDRAQHTLPLRG